MQTGIRDFLVKYKEKLTTEKYIRENPLDKSIYFKSKITFKINVYDSSGILVGYTGGNLFELDEEDLKYLYNKYSKGVEAEMMKNIEEVKNNYKDLLVAE